MEAPNFTLVKGANCSAPVEISNMTCWFSNGRHTGLNSEMLVFEKVTGCKGFARNIIVFLCTLPLCASYLHVLPFLGLNLNLRISLMQERHVVPDEYVWTRRFLCCLKRVISEVGVLWPSHWSGRLLHYSVWALSVHRQKSVLCLLFSARWQCYFLLLYISTCCIHRLSIYELYIIVWKTDHPVKDVGNLEANTFGLPVNWLIQIKHSVVGKFQRNRIVPSGPRVLYLLFITKAIYCRVRCAKTWNG